MISYNGAKNPIILQNSIKEITNGSLIYKLLNHQKMAIAGRNMKGREARWFLDYRQQKLDQEDTFDDFTNRQRKQFVKVYDIKYFYNKLISCVQSGSVEQYSIRLNNILVELPRDFLGEQAKLATYINILKSQIKSHVIVQQLSILNEAVKYALLFEAQYTDLSWRE